MEAIVAVFVVGALALGLWGFLNLREGREREKKNENKVENKVDRAAQWRELCSRLSDTATTSGLHPYIDEHEDSLGGNVRVLWESSGSSEKVLSVYFPAEDHPPGRTRLVSSYGHTGKTMVRSYSPSGFPAFIDYLERIIGNYKSPLFRGDDKPKL